MPARLDASLRAIGKRLKEIRGKRFQEPFLADLEQRTKHKISQSAYSRMENGKEAITAEDIVALAQMDPKKRGREWLAFGVYEARYGRRTTAAVDEELSPEVRRPLLQVAEQGRNGPATAGPSESPIPPSRRPRRRKP